MEIFESYSYDETQEIAKKLTDRFKAGDFVAMYGDLGAGKTAFIQGVAKALGVKNYVTSPTFTIVNEYNGTIPLYHFDVYRITDVDEMYEIGYDDYISAGGLCIVEWAELIEDIFPESYYKITILKNEKISYQYRKIILEKFGGR